jgi:hypothetical protein
MKRNVHPKTTNETSNTEHTSLHRFGAHDGLFRVDAADIETPTRKVDDVAAPPNAWAICGRGS